PALPTPRRCIYCPVATPAGTLSSIERSPRWRPSPRQALHGDAIITPSPRQVGHGATDTNCPKKLCCARRTSPWPLQVVQRVGFVPSEAPVPAQRSQGSSNLSFSVFVTPVATSSIVSCRSTFTSAPARGPLC